MKLLRVATLIALSLLAVQLWKVEAASACGIEQPTGCVNTWQGPLVTLDLAVTAAPFLIFDFAPGERSRGYGLAEAVVHAPLSLAWTAAAVRTDTGELGFVAALHGGLAIHGIWMMVRSRESQSPPATIRLGGVRANITPTAVSDGQKVASGLAIVGRF